MLRISVDPLCLDDGRVQELTALRKALEEGKTDLLPGEAPMPFPVATSDDLQANEALQRHLLEVVGAKLFRGAPVEVHSVVIDDNRV